MAVRVEKADAVTTVILDRRERRNAIDPATGVALREAFAAFDADPDAAVAVLWGEGGHFCAGFDLKHVADVEPVHDPLGEGLIGPTRMLLSKPVIAAVEGYAVAGGLELALWCDMRVAGESATFGVFCRRWGVPLIDGGTVRLPRIVGHARALDMILTGRPVGAAEALSWGLANRVVPDGTARDAAEALAATIARFPQICLRADRMSAHLQWGQDIAAAVRDEAMRGERPLAEEARGGAARFAGGLGRGGDFAEI
ncbi:MAG TPA: crotonase/enoyl-CoA hydratase family protein [Acidisphaera sp.]|nr:crotonase/enoyl-CoA hydratase family protein [Acidisphaera sp.]